MKKSLYNESQNNGDLPPEPSISIACFAGRNLTRLNNGEPWIENGESVDLLYLDQQKKK
jgi:hypothetical protein